MATTSRKGSRVFFRSKEATAGTADTYDNFEGNSIIASFPTTSYMNESDKNKIGSGEHGRKSETQAVITPVSIKASRLSEVAYLMSYAMGTADDVDVVASGVHMHTLKPFAVSSRTMPTTTMEYGNTVAAMDQFKHLIINDFSVTIGSSETGVIDATFNGFANLHYLNTGVLTRNAAVNNSAFSAGNDFSAEPLINFFSTGSWIGATENTPFVPGSVDFNGSDLNGSTDLTAALNSITFGMNNGITQEMLLRAAGGGVINNAERGERSLTLELQFRKDTDFAALSLANTQKALEIQFAGPEIDTGYRYGMDLFWPVVQFMNPAQDDGSPINETVSCEVFENSSAEAFIATFQSGVANGYNATLT